MLPRILPLVMLASSTLAGYSWLPPSVPLAVKSPYLSAWLPIGQGTTLNNAWPQFWAGQVLGWAGFAKIDGQPYSFLGHAGVSNGGNFTRATQKSFEFTATRSIFVLSAGPVDLTVTFLSPIYPDDILKHSLPFSYLHVSAASTDGAAHSVQVYSDISAEWSSGTSTWTAVWGTNTTDNIVSHQVQTFAQATFEEANDQIQHGSVYYSTLNNEGATYQTGSDGLVRGQFLKNGVLANTQDTDYRPISDQWPVFGLAHDLGQVTGAKAVVYSVGHIREPAVYYAVEGNRRQERSHYFWSKYSNPLDLVTDFLNDYDNALSINKALDEKIDNDAKKISEDYAGIVALSVRQALAATEVTISKSADGSWNTTDILVFLKEISSNGNTNTVDVIFPAWPALLYINPLLGKYLTDVLYRYQAAGIYPNKYAIHDTGAHYPKAVGHADGLDEPMPLEECGNMIIMALSYVNRTGDVSQITRYAGLIDQWTQFLIDEALIPANQLSTDDFAGHLVNQTNLAIKGIIGIRASAEIASILGDNEKSDKYKAIAADYVTKWHDLAISNTGEHYTLSYNQHDTWGLAYNLYADKLFKFNLFPQSVYELQTKWYKTVANEYGVPLDTRHEYTKTDWEIWTAAIVTDTEARDLFISRVKKFASAGTSNVPFSDWHSTETGRSMGFRARPVAGGHLAFLILPD